MKMRAGLVIRFAWEKISVLLPKITTSNPLSKVNTDLAYFLWQSWGQTYLYYNYFFTDLNRYIYIFNEATPCRHYILSVGFLQFSSLDIADEGVKDFHFAFEGQFNKGVKDFHFCIPRSIYCLIP